jgi:hypothetical protein
MVNDISKLAPELHKANTDYQLGQWEKYNTFLISHDW